MSRVAHNVYNLGGTYVNCIFSTVIAEYILVVRVSTVRVVCVKTRKRKNKTSKCVRFNVKILFLHTFDNRTHYPYIVNSRTRYRRSDCVPSR